MNDTNFLQNTQDKYICGQYDNKLGVCDWLTVDVQFSIKMRRAIETRECQPNNNLQFTIRSVVHTSLHTIRSRLDP